MTEPTQSSSPRPQEDGHVDAGAPAASARDEGVGASAAEPTSASVLPGASTPGEAAARTKPQRPATLVFTQAVLLLEAFVALFATLVAWSFARTGLVDANPVWMLALGLLLMLALGYASGQQKKRWGRWLGWILQVPLLVGGIIDPMIAVIGAVFLIIWIMALRLGGRIDRERKERDEAAAHAASPAAAPGEDAP